jgi:hypothetical protein
MSDWPQITHGFERWAGNRDVIFFTSPTLHIDTQVINPWLDAPLRQISAICLANQQRLIPPPVRLMKSFKAERFKSQLILGELKGNAVGYWG